MHVIWATTILVAQTTAIREGILTAVQATIKDLLVEEDNVIIIQPVRGEIKVP